MKRATGIGKGIVYATRNAPGLCMQPSLTVVRIVQDSQYILLINEYRGH